MNNDLIDVCISATRRNYPAGYGFALGYLCDNPGPDALKAMRAQAADVVARWIKATVARRPYYGDDVARFVSAVADQPKRGGWEWWLIEAAQLVHADALAGNAKSAAVMVMWQHPGY